MNILFIGPYRQQDGWGEAARAYALSLAHTKHNICIRPIYMADNIANDIPQELIILESNKYKKYDVVIQNCLPHFFDYHHNMNINIGLMMLETMDLQHSLWPAYMQTMDTIWSPSAVQDRQLAPYNLRSHHVVPIATNLNKFKVTYPQFALNIKDSFNFYFIGDCIHRKNIITISTAFHLEFHKSEPVNLILKLNKHGMQPQALESAMREQINANKQYLRLYVSPDQYKQEIIITDRLNNEELYSLHQACHCFIMASCGEAWCQPAHDAMGFGKPSIVTNHTGATSFINNNNGWLIKSYKTPVITKEPPIPNIYNGYESWMTPDINSLRQHMRQAYNDQTLYNQKAEQCKKDIKKYSYKRIAKIIERVL